MLFIKLVECLYQSRTYYESVKPSNPSTYTRIIRRYGTSTQPLGNTNLAVANMDKIKDNVAEGIKIEISKTVSSDELVGELNKIQESPSKAGMDKALEGFYNASPNLYSIMFYESGLSDKESSKNIVRNLVSKLQRPYTLKQSGADKSDQFKAMKEAIEYYDANNAVLTVLPKQQTIFPIEKLYQFPTGFLKRLYFSIR
ncbi:hypothetical protein ECANGB1_2062 [Enterospora canceri]|uniref:Uncharacterized protein n=1 Tax=Enterospora canceri TaxID=1081671 RepID=A0A1Y1S8T0_9MICR|nr:hypothetical protein ECANGB1_2062 [Enterospora canceri]